MSTELKTVSEDGAEGKENPAVSLTSFFGGVDRGRCVQLTQSHRTPEGFTAHAIPAQTLALTEHQAVELIEVLSKWLGGEFRQPVTEEQVREIFLQMQEEKDNEPRDLTAIQQSG